MDAGRRKKMRKLILAATLALAFVFSLEQSTALAASATSQTIDVTGNASFSSILGGSVNGQVALSGAVSDGQLGALRGSANFPLRDEKLSVAATTSIFVTTEQMNVGWYRFTCDQFGCVYENGVSVFARTYASGPVDIRLGSLKGNGTLSLGTNATCVSACPPPGASWYAPTGYWQIQGAVLSSQDAGGLSIYGPAPTIR
jgi:hypothetical protein